MRDAQDEVLDEVGDAAVGDDEESRDGPGHPLGEVVSLGGASVVSFGGRLTAARARRRARYQLPTYKAIV